MTKKHSTKKILTASIFSLILCCSMLIGTTFAWFTDSVTSKGNIIKSGSLDIVMEWKDATATGAQQTYKDASEGAIFNYEKWEPGYIEAKNIKISNAGTLALKYQLAIIATGEVSKLADVIDVYYAEGEYDLDNREMTELTKLGTLSTVLANLSTTANGDLLKDETDIVTLALKMQETANDEYQELSIGSEFAVKCFATQLAAEKDSFDNQYDKLATIDTESELLEALATDYDLIQIGSNIELANSVAIPAGKTVTIDLAGYTISQTKGNINAPYAMISNKGTLTIEDSIGTGKLSFADTTPYTADIGWASNTIRNEGALNVNGGTIENLTAAEIMNYSFPHAIDCYQGSVTTINGGTVKSANYDSVRMFCNSTTLATTVTINGGTIMNRVSFHNPGSDTAGYGVLNINGGRFMTTDEVNANVRLLNFSSDCSNMKATVTGGFFDKGFKTQDIVACGVETSDWLAISNATIAVSNNDQLAAALKSGNDGGTIMLNAGTYKLPTITKSVAASGLTIVGSEGAAIRTQAEYKYSSNVYNNVTFKNVTFDLKYFLSLQFTGVSKLENCYITNTNTSYAYPSGLVGCWVPEGSELIIDRCTFKFNEMSNEMANIGGGGAIEVKNTSFEDGCLILDLEGVYTNCNFKHVDVVGYIDCTFEDCTFDSTSAVRVHNSETEVRTLTLNGCTIIDDSTRTPIDICYNYKNSKGQMIVDGVATTGTVITALPE